jgi:hypothetical protein
MRKQDQVPKSTRFQPYLGLTVSVLALLLVLTWPLTSVRAEPMNPSEAPLSLLDQIEMEAHQRLIEVMRERHYQPLPFVTDGCSGGLSLAWTAVSGLAPSFAAVHEARPPWEGCCITHDQAYHAASSAETAQESFDERLAADERLRRCVLETGKQRTAALVHAYPVTAEQVEQLYDFVAHAMFDAVRLGGGPCSGLPWRWGYGYPGCLWRE